MLFIGVMTAHSFAARTCSASAVARGERRGIADSSTDANKVRISPGLFQPIAADDVAANVADVAVSAPRNGIVEIAGPSDQGRAANGTAQIGCAWPCVLDAVASGVETVEEIAAGHKCSVRHVNMTNSMAFIDVANRNRKKLGSKRQLTGFIFFSWQRRAVHPGPEHPREWCARLRGGLGLPRMLPASGVHINTNGFQA
jgi:hypothetical protein